MNLPIARNTDPWTSHAAAREITRSGRRQTIRERVLETVRQRPGLTAGEIGELVGVQDAWKRVSELVRDGEAVYGAAREWRGNRQRTVWPVREQGELL